MTFLTRRDFHAALALAATTPWARSQPGVGKTDPINVPARAVTKGPKHHFFGYYDKSPWDKTGRYILSMEIDFCDRQPNPGDKLTVGMVDLQDNDRYIPLDSTPAWCWQQGTMLQWLGNTADRDVVYNSVADGKYVAIVRDVHSGITRTLPRPVYSPSRDGTRAVSLDFARLHRLRPGYGYATLPEQLASDPAPETLGIWHMDMATGKNELIVNLKQLAGFKPDDRFANAEHWVNHLLWNPGGTRIVFLHRWRIGPKPWATRVFTVKPDGSDLRLHLDTGMASHFDWRDDDTLLFWAKTPDEGNAFCLIDVNTNAVSVIARGVLTQDGHCSYSPDGKWILNDTYPGKERKQSLMLYNPATNRRYDLNRFHSPPMFTGPWRCDLHPRWNRDGTMVCFDGCHDPQRQLYIVDVRDIVAS